MLTGSTADIDDIYILTSARRRALRRRGDKESGLAAELALAVGRLLSNGRDGELSWDWPGGLDWLAEVLGPPDRVQVGRMVAAPEVAATARSRPSRHDIFDFPSGGDIGLRVDRVATPFVPRLASTIGLGDTFTAGLLLAAAMEDA